MGTVIYGQRCCLPVWVIYYLRQLCHTTINQNCCNINIEYFVFTHMTKLSWLPTTLSSLLYVELPHQQDSALYYRPGTTAQVGWGLGVRISLYSMHARVYAAPIYIGKYETRLLQIQRKNRRWNMAWGWRATWILKQQQGFRKSPEWRAVHHAQLCRYVSAQVQCIECNEKAYTKLHPHFTLRSHDGIAQFCQTTTINGPDWAKLQYGVDVNHGIHSLYV